MRKIVCNRCAKDWGVQHVCMAYNAVPNVIWEPDEPPRKSKSLAYHRPDGTIAFINDDAPPEINVHGWVRTPWLDEK